MQSIQSHDPTERIRFFGGSRHCERGRLQNARYAVNDRQMEAALTLTKFFKVRLEMEGQHQFYLPGKGQKSPY